MSTYRLSSKLLKKAKRLRKIGRRSLFAQVNDKFLKKMPYLLEKLYKANPFLRQNEEKAREIVLSALEADPKGFKTKGKKTPFINQIIDWYIEKQIRLPEDKDVVRDALEIYNRLHFSEGIMPEKLSDFNTVHDFYEALEQYAAQQGEEVQTQAHFPLDVVFTSDDFFVYRLPDVWNEENNQLMEKIFEGTRWCVNNQQMYSMYKPPYFLVVKKNSGKRVALINPSSLQIKDTLDRPLSDPIAIKQLGPFISSLRAGFEGDFSVFITLDSPEIVRRLSTEQLAKILLGSEEVSLEVENVFVEKLSSALKKNNMSLICSCFSFFTTKSKHPQREKIVKEIEQAIINEFKEVFDRKSYVEIVNMITRFVVKLPESLKKVGFDVGLRLLNEGHRVLSSLTKFGTMYGVNNEQLSKIIEQAIGDHPASYAFMVRKKRKPVRILEEKGPENVLKSYDNVDPKQHIKDMLSGLVIYASNAHKGFPQWIKDAIIPSFIISSVRVLIPDVVIDEIRHDIETEVDKIPVSGIFSSFLKKESFQDLRLVSNIDAISFILEKQQAAQQSAQQVDNFVNASSSTIKEAKIQYYVRKRISDKLKTQLRQWLLNIQFEFKMKRQSPSTLEIFYKNFQGEERVFSNARFVPEALRPKNKGHTIAIKVPGKRDSISLFKNRIVKMENLSKEDLETLKQNKRYRAYKFLHDKIDGFSKGKVDLFELVSKAQERYQDDF